MEKETKMNDKFQKILKYWLPVFIWAFIIFSFSAYPTIRTSEIQWKDFFVKKSLHIIEYAIFASLLYRAIRKEGVIGKKAALYSIFFSVLYGLSDEFHQNFTPGREPKFRDVIFDTIGSFLAIYIIWKLLPRAPMKLKTWVEKLELK